ncbi:lipopolysaccharide biosynthesis protein [Halomicrobium sp. IBSBa]|uniref:lipopolysaccharide biosynthesis protein n=1 Tax=Halomicrobium sp. IBSBa TaxID=2778916 RepID=UPI001FC9C74F|nr:lipopolysaccharide biosynthesis protein [Halomicrobium sp. IBSBa]MBO4247838.1 lipopolysaccharide biosynthesis protein [Halomicrobium sp. IBSBa]
MPSASSPDSDTARSDEHSEASVEATLDDALERVAHGATVSIPGILFQRALTLAFTAVLTNGFSAGAYGVFAVARRLQRFLLHLALGFRSGLSRFLPNADSDAERDALLTVASLLLLGVATLFGAALYVATPLAVTVTGEGERFGTFLRIFAVGLPASVWLFTVAEMFRGFEAVGPLTLTLRIAVPTGQLLVGVAGTILFGDLAAVALGVVAVMGLVGVVAAVWLARDRGVRPRLRTDGEGSIWRRYVRYTAPLFAGGFATVVQRLGFYPLIALLLSGVAGGVFAVGVLLGSLVRLPLMGINQFIPPVAAALHEEESRAALSRLYHVTSRIVLVGVTALSVPVVVYREAVMALFGPTFVEYAPLLPGFVVAQYGACAAGSVGILLTMTDNQRALLIVNTVVTLLLIAVAVPLTLAYDLPGLVASYLLMLTLNNGFEVAVLYRLEGLQPFTRLHLQPIAAGAVLAAVTLGAKATLPSTTALVVGTAAGLVAYAAVLRWLGFTPTERRLAETLLDRYRTRLSRR